MSIAAFRELTINDWLIIGVLAVLYLVMTVRLAMWAHRNGHNGYLWFALSLLFTALPAMIYFRLLYARRQMDFIRGKDARGDESDDDERQPSRPRSAKTARRLAQRRCPHCRRLVVPKTDPSGLAICPSCGQPIEPGDVA
jgi:uncharacterized membrane protein